MKILYLAMYIHLKETTWEERDQQEKRVRGGIAHTHISIHICICVYKYVYAPVYFAHIHEYVLKNIMLDN